MVCLGGMNLKGPGIFMKGKNKNVLEIALGNKEDLKYIYLMTMEKKHDF